VLCFVGVKMVVSDFYHVPTIISLGTVAGILVATMLASYLATRREDVVQISGESPPVSNPHSCHLTVDTPKRRGDELP